MIVDVYLRAALQFLRFQVAGSRQAQWDFSPKTDQIHVVKGTHTFGFCQQALFGTLILAYIRRFVGDGFDVSIGTVDAFVQFRPCLFQLFVNGSIVVEVELCHTDTILLVVHHDVRAGITGRNKVSAVEL